MHTDYSIGQSELCAMSIGGLGILFSVSVLFLMQVVMEVLVWMPVKLMKDFLLFRCLNLMVNFIVIVTYSDNPTASSGFLHIIPPHNWRYA